MNEIGAWAQELNHYFCNNLFGRQTCHTTLTTHSYTHTRTHTQTHVSFWPERSTHTHTHTHTHTNTNTKIFLLDVFLAADSLDKVHADVSQIKRVRHGL